LFQDLIGLFPFDSGSRRRGLAAAAKDIYIALRLIALRLWACIIDWYVSQEDARVPDKVQQAWG